MGLSGGKMNAISVSPYGQGLCHCGCLSCRLKIFSDGHSTLGSNAQVVSESQRDLLSVLTFSLPLAVTFWTWQLLSAALSGIIWIAVMGNRPNHYLSDHPFGCFTNTLINMFQTELLISTSLLHLKPLPLPGLSISVNVFNLLLKPDAWKSSLIPSLSLNFHVTKSDDFCLQNLFPICSLFSLPSL